MPIYLDNQAVTLAGRTLGEVVDAAQASAAGAGRWIVEIELDGEPVLPEAAPAWRQTSIDGHEIRLTTVNPIELAVSVLHAARERLDEARRAQLAAADMLQRDRTDEALREVGKAVECWIEVAEAVTQTTRLAGIDLDTEQFGGRPGGELTRELLERLRDVKQVIHDSDTVALADALAYEWPEVTANWTALLGDLAERLDGEAG